MRKCLAPFFNLWPPLGQGGMDLYLSFSRAALWLGEEAQGNLHAGFPPLFLGQAWHRAGNSAGLWPGCSLCISVVGRATCPGPGSLKSRTFPAPPVAVTLLCPCAQVVCSSQAGLYPFFSHIPDDVLCTQHVSET